jgi:hypothetical protein
MKFIFLAMFLSLTLSTVAIADINLKDGDFMICNGHDSHFTYEFYLVNKASGQAFVKTVVGFDQEHQFPNAIYRGIYQ